MYSHRDNHSTPFLFTATHRLAQAASLASLLAFMPTPPLGALSALPTYCADSFELEATYPELPTSTGPDLQAEPGLVIYAQDGRSVVELDGCLYQFNRPLELDFSGLTGIQLLFEVPENEGAIDVIVTAEDGTSEVLEVGGSRFDYYMLPDSILSFEFVPQAQTAPTVPIIVVKPTRDDPSPS